MSEKDYLTRDKKVVEKEHAWCRLSKEGSLEYVDWIFVEKQAAQFDTIGEAGARDSIMTMCKLMSVVRRQTLEKSVAILNRFAEYDNDVAAILIYDPTKKKVDSGTFVFFHVGDDISQPTRLVDSIEKTNPGAKIVMCTDSTTPEVTGAERFECEVDRERLMPSRWKAYKELNLAEPAIYLDTDMVVRGQIDTSSLLNGKRFVFCRRTFDVLTPFNGNQRGLDFSEHADRPIGIVYPILGCFVITRNGTEWASLYDRCAALPEKYQKWYGDQEVLREIINELKAQDFNLVEELSYGCLPEHADKGAPFIVHYKGGRKNATA